MISTSHNGSYRQTPSLQKNIISDQVSYPPQIENYLDKYQPYKGQSNSTQHLLRAASQNNNSHNYSHQDEINATIGQLTNHGDNLRLINVPYYQSQDQQFRAKGEQYKMFNNCENTRQQGDYNQRRPSPRRSEDISTQNNNSGYANYGQNKFDQQEQSRQKLNNLKTRQRLSERVQFSGRSMYDPNMSTTPSTITTINRPEHIAQPPLQFTKTTSCAPVATSRNHEPRIIRRQSINDNKLQMNEKSKCNYKHLGGYNPKMPSGMNFGTPMNGGWNNKPYQEAVYTYKTISPMVDNMGIHAASPKLFEIYDNGKQKQIFDVSESERRSQKEEEREKERERERGREREKEREKEREREREREREIEKEMIREREVERQRNNESAKQKEKLFMESLNRKQSEITQLNYKLEQSIQHSGNRQTEIAQLRMTISILQKDISQKNLALQQKTQTINRLNADKQRISIQKQLKIRQLQWQQHSTIDEISQSNSISLSCYLQEVEQLQRNLQIVSLEKQTAIEENSRLKDEVIQLSASLQASENKLSQVEHKLSQNQNKLKQISQALSDTKRGQISMEKQMQLVKMQSKLMVIKLQTELGHIKKELDKTKDKLASDLLERNKLKTENELLKFRQQTQKSANSFNDRPGTSEDRSSTTVDKSVPHNDRHKHELHNQRQSSDIVRNYQQLIRNLSLQENTLEPIQLLALKEIRRLRNIAIQYGQGSVQKLLQSQVQRYSQKCQDQSKQIKRLNGKVSAINCQLHQSHKLLGECNKFLIAKHMAKFNEKYQRMIDAEDEKMIE